MLSAFPRRMVSLAAIVGVAFVLPLSACGPGTTPSDRGSSAPPATAPPTDAGAIWGLERGRVADATPDADAIWGVVQELPARDVEILYASFTLDVREDLAAIVHAAAESVRG